MIEVSNLSKNFGAVRVLRDVSFYVKAGETFALLGPNGSGKTTTLKSIVGLITPTTGEIKVNGLSVQKSGRETRRFLTFLPQRVTFPENVTGREVLEFYCRLRKLPAARIGAAIEKANFNGFSGKLVSEFSGGMIQRLAIAVALLPDVPVLVLDEPTVSLDPASAITLKKLMISLKSEGRTVVFSTHLLADVEHLADRVGILVGGRLVVEETVETLRQAHQAASRLQITLRHPEQRFAALCRDLGATAADLDEDMLVVRSRPEDRLKMIHTLERAGAEIVRFETKEPTLEEIYLEHVDETRSVGGNDAVHSLSKPASQTG